MHDLKLSIAMSRPEDQRSQQSKYPTRTRPNRTRRSLLIVVSLLLTLLAIFLIRPAQVAKVQSSESECFNFVQERIAWNYEGNRSWSPTNVQNLCRGTSNPRQPGRCFDRAMHGRIDWGGGTNWQWENALALCAGTNDADGTIACFQDGIRNGLGWSEAIKACNERRCSNLVQGQIAWNYEGTRSWAANNVQNLCRGTSNPTQPPSCFARVMHGGINWGGGTRWQWENALALCGGSNNAGNTVSCFQARMRARAGWSEAIRACKANTGG